jgi:hypothetical protein
MPFCRIKASKQYAFLKGVQGGTNLDPHTRSLRSWLVIFFDGYDIQVCSNFFEHGGIECRWNVYRGPQAKAVISESKPSGTVSAQHFCMTTESLLALARN